jgi:hypothetical protein
MLQRGSEIILAGGFVAAGEPGPLLAADLAGGEAGDGGVVDDSSSDPLGPIITRIPPEVP